MTTKTAAPAQTTHCRRCGRVLSDPKAVAAGYGRTCLRRIADAAKAAAQTESAQRVDAATEAIEDGAVVHQTRDLWLVVSTAGDAVYTVDAAAGSCTCLAAEHHRPCWHRAAVSLLGVPVAPVPPIALATPVDPFANVVDAADLLAAQFAADKAEWLARQAA